MRALSRRLLAGVGAAALVASAAYADTQAIDVRTVGTYPPLSSNGFNYFQAPGGYTFSWNFTLNSPIQVTQLGYYNSALAGTPETNGFGSHLVTLFDVSTDTQIADATVTARSPATGVFNYAPITPVSLSASDAYTLSGDMTDQYYLVGLNQAAAPSAPQINYRFTNDGSIFGSPPPPGTYDDFGPNFQFATAATCTENVPGRNVIALVGDKCAAAGTYDPTSSKVTLPVTYNGFGLYANGGTITSTGPVTITATDPRNAGGSYGVWADGGGARIALGGATSIATVGSASHGAFASGGGQIVASGPLSVSTTGGGAIGLYALGPGSAIDGTLGSITTAGSFASGAQAEAGGALTLGGGTVATSGPNAIGLLATGAHSQIIATGVVVSTNGAFAAAVQSDSGGAVNLGGGALTTNGAGSAGVYATGGGTVAATGGVAVKTTGGGSIGVHALGLGSSVAFSLGAITTVGAGSADAKAEAGGVLTLSGVVVKASGQNAIGVTTTGGASTSLVGGSVATTGGQGDAIYGAGGGATNLVGVRLTTSGNAAKGIDIQGTGTTLTGANLTILTTGTLDPATDFRAQGVYNGGAAAPGTGTTGGGSVVLNSSSIATRGASANGVETADGGTTSLNGGSISTLGARASALVARSGGVVDVTPDTAATGTAISTAGASAFGAYAFGGAKLTLRGADISTSGVGAAGLILNGAGTKVTATGVTIATRLGVDTTTGDNAHAIYNGPGQTETSGGLLTLTNVKASTQGLQAKALLTRTGGVTNVTGGVFSTSGADASAVDVNGAGTLTISGAEIATPGDGSAGLVIVGAGGTVDASHLTISTSGGVWSGNGSQAHGVYNGGFGNVAGGGEMTLTDSVVTTTGAQSDGVSVGAGGSTTFLGGAVSAAGVGAHAASASKGGSLVIGLDPAGSGAGLSTLGAGAYVVVASGGGLVSLTGATLGSTGDGSGGLGVNGAGSQIDARNVILATGGGFDPVSGLHAYGAANAPFGTFTTGGTLKLTGSQITTLGEDMHGVYTGASSATTISGGSVATFGAGAHALYATGAGASVTAGGATLFTRGAGAYDAYVAAGASLALEDGMRLQANGAGGGGVYVTDKGSHATIRGNVGILSPAGASGLYVGAGATVALKGVLAIRSAGTGISVNGGSVDAPGALNLTTTSAAGPALTLSGDNSTFNGTGGGSIDAAGSVVQFLNGANQSASFVGYTINSASGDFAFADPSTSTLNFTNTSLNAAGGHLVNATAGSTVTLNASGSTLVGAIATDATSTTHVNLSNASSLTLTGPSTITNLDIANSVLGFSAPTNGGFHTLTVTNFTGSGGALTLNAALGGPTPGADQIIVNGGRATGTTLLTISPVGGFAGPTSGAGVPLVVATNGGAIAPGAFALARPLVVNGFAYSLKEQAGGDFLVSNTTQTAAQATASLASLSQTRQTQTITTKLLGSILTGATEQINCSSCSSGFASFGSFALGLHGRWTLNDNFAILAGGSYDSFSSHGVSVNNSMQVALALRYDAVQMGKNRPFVEAGVTAQPWASVTYRRAYESALGGGVGVGTTLSRSVAAYGRLGYIWRLGRADEAAVYGDLTRSWDYTAGYTESASSGNPNGASFAPTLDRLNVARLGGQYTHLFGQHIEGNLSAGYARAFGAAYGTSAALGGLGVSTGSAATGFDWFEGGARVSYRFSRTITGDLFGVGTLGAQPVGDQIHGGLALRMAF